MAKKVMTKVLRVECIEEDSMTTTHHKILFLIRLTRKQTQFDFKRNCGVYLACSCKNIDEYVNY